MGVIISEAVNEATTPPKGMQRECGNYQLTRKEFEIACNGEQNGVIVVMMVVVVVAMTWSGQEIGLIVALRVVFVICCASLIINILCLLKQYLGKDN